MGRKWMACLAAALLLLAALVSAQAEEAPLDSEEALMAFLGQCREAGQTEFEVTLEKAFFDAVSADNFSRLRVIGLKAGISDDAMYYYSSGRLMFSEVVWGANAVECATAEDALAAVLGFTAERADSFQLICPPGLSQALRGDNLIYAFAAQGGAEDLSLSYSAQSGILYISDVVYLAMPYAVVSDGEQFTAAIDRFAAQGAAEFSVVFTPAFYERICEEGDLLRVMQASSRLETYRSRQSSAFRWIEYTDVTYSGVPRVVCETKDDITEAIRRMGGAGADAFDLVLTETLYNTVKEDYFNALRQLEGEAGMTSSSMAYNDTSYILCYTDAVIVSHVVRLNTAAEANAFVAERAAAGEKEIALFCSEGLYTLLIGNLSPFAFAGTGMSPIYDVAAQAGLFDYTFNYSDTTRIIQLHVAAFYPGTDIVSAVRRGDFSALTARERETWQAATLLAAECISGDPLSTARAIHDRLCAMIVYTDDESTDEDDTAIGALLNGRANCDGYADAFYLVGTLAGLNVRYQHGDSYDMGLSFDFGNSVTHLWNLIEIDGSWRLVDVTWDDNDENGVRYTWFNLGRDRASRMHIWNSETSVPLLSETDLSVRPGNEYLVATMDEAAAAIDSAFSRRFSSFEIIFADENAASSHQDVLDRISRRASSSFRYLWNDKMLTLTVFGL